MNIPVSKFFYLFSNLCDPTAVEVAVYGSMGRTAVRKKVGLGMDAVSMFQTQVYKVSCQVEKVSFETGPGWLGGQGKQTNCEERGLFLKERLTFSGGRWNVSCWVPKQRFRPGKGVFSEGKRNVCRRGCGIILKPSFKTRVLRWRKKGFRTGRNEFVSSRPPPPSGLQHKLLRRRKRRRRPPPLRPRPRRQQQQQQQQQHCCGEVSLFLDGGPWQAACKEHFGCSG